jgi:hypothetical protein
VTPRLAHLAGVLVLLIAKDEIDDNFPQCLESGLPHLADADRRRIASRYLGQATWNALCNRFDLGPLPATAKDAAAKYGWLRLS